MSFEETDRQPLLHYSEEEERANLFDTAELNSSMPSKKKGGKRKKARKVVKGQKGVRFNKGRVALKLKGYQGVQRIAPAELVRFIKLNKLKVLAKKVLTHHGGKKIKRKKRKGKRK